MPSLRRMSNGKVAGKEETRTEARPGLSDWLARPLRQSAEAVFSTAEESLLPSEYSKACQRKKQQPAGKDEPSLRCNRVSERIQGVVPKSAPKKAQAKQRKDAEGEEAT